ncbi:MAG: hypothetical protein N0C84_11540 [Candidatus Thiodiazotropha taylori]|uniref:Uncharacterized protein n=1 Tax=Candidatus Thiodiazotropha taylori TaxID=2792791 RepID=A0A9E4KEU8_9GAMM|nr:hypothetical protein [Candidatus Thiodiazotropha taylori]MCW4257086.1 hypothetical protein [Candidatus Thiodiazotropha taylori]
MFLVSDPARKKLIWKQRLNFWVHAPVVLLFTHKKSGIATPIIKARVLSEKKMEEHYFSKIIEINGLKIIPNFDVVLNRVKADRWLLDIDSTGTFILFADDKRIVPLWPVDNQGHPQK